jgi:glycosyltransferase involved in cell wall biosynthesis
VSDIFKNAKADDDAVPLLFNWQIAPMIGWGQFGLNLFVELVSHSEQSLYPLLLDSRPMSRWIKVLGSDVHRSWRKLSRHARHQQLLGASIESLTSSKEHDCFPLLVSFPIVHQIAGAFEIVASHPQLLWSETLNVGVVFFENVEVAVSAQALAGASRYDVVVVGSTWNAEVLRDALPSSSLDVRTVFQGVDVDMFRRLDYVARKTATNGVALFSGGKLEFRKGQDIVVAVYRRLLERFPGARLVTAWFSNWPAATMHSLRESPHLHSMPPIDELEADQANHQGERQAQIVHRWLVDYEHLPADQLDVHGFLRPKEAAKLLASKVSVALFPNRAEGGTNLVAMEAMAVGLPVVLSDNTGHRDLIRGGDGSDDFAHCYAIRDQRAVLGRRGWGESSVDEALSLVTHALEHLDEADQMGQRAARFIRERFTWRHTADRFVGIVSQQK